MLAGTTIVDLSRLLPGPYCTMLLADLGARVILVEPPRSDSDVSGTEFPSLLRNKERMVLDLKRPAGREVFLRLAGAADAVVEGFRPGTLARLGVDYDTVSAAHPHIVYCSITGYGQSGPMAAAAGHDVNFLARSGVLSLLGVEPGGPLPAIQVADTAGATMGALTLLAALHERNRTGRGRHLDISMTDAAQALPVISQTFALAGEAYGAGTSPVAGGLACYSTYRTRDGRGVAVGALEPVFFRRLCEALDADDLIPRQFERAAQPWIRESLAAAFAQRTRDEWDEFFRERDACVTGILTYGEASAQPWAEERGALRRAWDARGRSVPVLGLPLPEPTPCPEGGPVAVRGAHTDSLLDEMGYAPAEIAALRKGGVVG